MAGKRNNGRSRRHGAGSGDHGRRREREEGNDRAWKEYRAAAFSLPRTALAALFALISLVVAIYRLEPAAAVHAGIVGLLSSMGALVLVPTDAMRGLVTIGVVFFIYTVIAMVCVFLTR